MIIGLILFSHMIRQIARPLFNSPLHMLYVRSLSCILQTLIPMRILPRPLISHFVVVQLVLIHANARLLERGTFHSIYIIGKNFIMHYNIIPFVAIIFRDTHVLGASETNRQGLGS